MVETFIPVINPRFVAAVGITLVLTHFLGWLAVVPSLFVFVLLLQVKIERQAGRTSHETSGKGKAPSIVSRAELVGGCARSALSHGAREGASSSHRG